MMPLTRYRDNPILEPADMPFPCYAVFNAGAIRFKGRYLLLLRVDDLTRKSRFHLAHSENGVDFKVDPEPVVLPRYSIEARVGQDRWGAFDMRVTELDGLYYIFHALPLRDDGCCIGLCTTSDFKVFEPIYASQPFNRNAVLFPEKINGLYCRLDRPQNTNEYGAMWVSYSPDLRYWGDHMPLQTPVTPWNSLKSGAGCIPIKTDKGWLIIYHGVGGQASGVNYFLGACLLDLANPENVIAAPREFILAPEKDYECIGQVPNVVFTGGAIETDEGVLNIYYGGADTRICLAQTTVGDLVRFCIEHDDPSARNQ